MSQTVGLTSEQRSLGDALATGVVAMLAINIVQRLVGLGRNLGFSMLLPQDELGLWSMANSFFVLAPPLIVLGLPGSFGKFVEAYRQSGGLAHYLYRVALVCVATLITVSVVMLVQPQHTSWLLYGQPQPFEVVCWTVVTLLALTVHNVIYDVVLSLRQVRLASMMQFVHSVSFCGMGLLGIYLFKTWAVLLPSFALAYLLAMIPGLLGLSVLKVDVARINRVKPVGMWRRILPFAMTLWITNLLTNTFELSDRYMLLHLSCVDIQAAQANVGQFYCGRIMPNLLLSLAMMFSGIILPYLSLDWERRRYEQIRQLLNRVMVVLCFVLTGLGVGALAAAPMLFDWVLGGRYAPAASVLSLGLMQAIWSGLTMVGSAYLFCAEKGRQSALMLAVALILNVGLNWLFIQSMGLYGAALATAIANAWLLWMMLWRLEAEGCKILGSTKILCCLPLLLLAGATSAAVGFVLLVIICGRTNWILSELDRRQIDNWNVPRLNRLGLPLETVW